MKKKFIRQDYMRLPRLGKGRKKLQKWRRPKGRDSKMRENRRSYPAVVRVGYKTPAKDSGKIKGMTPVRVCNVAELEKVKKDNVIIVGKVGAKKKMDILKKAEEMKFKVVNLGGKNETGR